MWQNAGRDDESGGHRDVWYRRRRIIFLAVVTGLLWAGILAIGWVLASQKEELRALQAVDVAAPLFHTGSMDLRSGH